MVHTKTEIIKQSFFKPDLKEQKGKEIAISDIYLNFQKG